MMWKQAYLFLGPQNKFQRLVPRKSCFSLGKLLGCGNECDTWTEEEDLQLRKWASYTISLADEGVS